MEGGGDGVRGPVNLGVEVSEERFAEDAIVTRQVGGDEGGRVGEIGGKLYGGIL